MNTQEAAEAYLKHISTKVAPATYRSYANALTAFVRSSNDFDVADLKPDHIGTFVHVTMAKEYSRSTANLYAVAVRAWIKFLIGEGHLDWTLQQAERTEALLKDMRPKRKSRLPKLPSEAEVTSIRSAVQFMDWASPIVERNRALIEVLYSTGCRIDEVVHLRVRDIDINKREARVIGKGDKERVVFLSPTAVNACVQYMVARALEKDFTHRRDDPLFARHDDGAGKKKPYKRLSTQGARDVVLALAKAEKIDHFTPHSFRHYFATRMLEETDNLSIVQLALGHSSPDTTAIYAKANPQTVRRAHQEVFGK